MTLQTSHLWATAPEGVDTSFEIVAVRPVLLSAVYEPHEWLEWVGGTIRSWDAGLVEVTLADGSTGLGEAGAAIMAADAVPGLVDAFRPYLLERRFGHPSELGAQLRAYTAFWARGGIANGVAGALEAAALDAVAGRAGIPAHRLLGTAAPTIETYASGGLGTTFDEVLAWAVAQVDAGFETVKFRAMRDPETTIELLDSVVPRLPAGTQFVLDAVQGCAAAPWSVAEAIRVGEHAARHGARWYEEPGHASRPADYAAVRAVVEVPVSGVESYALTTEFQQLLDLGGVDIAQPDATFVGGPRAFLEVADAAQAAGVAAIPHVWGSAVTYQTNLHSAAVHPNVRVFETCTLPNPLRDALLAEPVRREGPTLHVPETPGLGLRLTPEIEKRFPYRSGAGHVIR